MRLLVLLLLFASPLAAQRRQSIDYVLAGGTTGMIVADWGQTLQIARYSRAELNPLLGSHPSLGRVNTYFSLALVANLSAFALPRRSRRVIYSAVLALESLMVLNNAVLGWRVGF